MRGRICFFGIIATVLFSAGSAFASSEETSFVTEDGLRVFAEYEVPDGPSRGVVVLFHMAGSNRGEYTSVVPMLKRAGFATLAVDQRVGGAMWGRYNKTSSSTKRSFSFAEVLPDLNAAVDYAKERKAGPIVVWGSSYSAALALLTAAKRDDLSAVLAFSPAEYIDGQSVALAASKIKVPVFITAASNDVEYERANMIARRASAQLVEQYIASRGIHGTSTLNPALNPDGASENWRAVNTFLDRAVAQ